MPSIKDEILRKSEIENRRKNLPKGGIFMERELYLSDAFLSMRKNSMKALIAFLDIRLRARNSKGKFKNGQYSNLDHLEMPYGTLQKKFKIPRGSIAPAIDELLEKGFVTIKHIGGTYRHDKTIYAWSDNWVIWRKGVVFNTRNKDPKRGFQGKNLGAAKKILGHEIEPLHRHEIEPLNPN